MIRFGSIIVAAVLLSAHVERVQAGPLPIEVYFSPRGGCTEAITRALGAAKRSVLVQAYDFTSPAIAKALVDAHGRGVAVEAVLDKGNRKERYSQAPTLIEAGIPVFIEEIDGVAHSKIMIIDGEEVITGSFNFTKAAEDRNSENLLVIHDRGIAEKYIENYVRNKGLSKPF